MGEVEGDERHLPTLEVVTEAAEALQRNVQPG